MDSYPNIFDDLISKVEVEIKGSDRIPRLIEKLVNETYQEEENYEDSGNQT
jgi:hypothetical protein